MTTTLTKILALADADPPAPVSTIAANLSVSPGYVYGVLREHRPTRKRKAHKRSDRHYKIVNMHFLEGKSATQIADELGLKRQGVHRHLSK